LTAVQKVTKLGVSYVIRQNKRVSPGNIFNLVCLIFEG